MKWISVEERLPQPGDEICILTKENHFDFSHYAKDYKATDYSFLAVECCDNSPFKNVTHWIPLKDFNKFITSSELF